MRILMLGWEFPPDIVGGLGTACAGLVRALDRLGHEVTFVMPAPASRAVAIRADPDRVQSAPIPGTAAARQVVLPLIVGPAYVPLGAESLAARDPGEASARYAALALSTLERGAFDIVHAHDWLTLAAGRLAARRLGVPFVAHVHSLECDRAGESGDGRIEALEREGLGAAGLVVTVSRRERDLCRARCAVDPARCEVVYNGIDPAASPRAPRPEGSARTVLFLGRLTAQKGPSHFLRMARALASRFGGVRFIMAGEGDQAGAMRWLAAELGIADRVAFPGFVRGPAWSAAFAEADCFVMTSVSEPFGLAALEAIQQGVPAVVPPEAGVAEAVPSLPTCDPRRAGPLADVVASLLFDGARAARTVLAARTESAHLTWERAAAECAAVYRRAGATPAATGT